MESYNPTKIEKKWQEIWQKTKIYETDLKSGKPKHYNLVMFPYPSGEYLHIGHVYSYSGADVYARYKKLNSFNIFEPIGYDSFGLPAENFAIKKGVHPKQSTEENIKHSKKQLVNFGCMFDFSREVTTSDPSYYKWTQWLFLQLYKQGLAYQKEAPVNWCPKCLTVLANEQVINGLCERCDTEVVQKNMKQWFFKITDYAERLIKDLDKVDWPESSIVKQRNWIGHSEGVEFEMEVVGHKDKISTFTTRIDTVFGMTYIVLAPEHNIIQNLKHKIQNWQEVEKYIIKAQRKTEVERASLDKQKTGIELKGINAINPFNNEKMPIWIADYVILSYGTGAVMAVSAHDERDFEFAKKYKLPIKEVVTPLVIKEDSPDAFRKDLPIKERNAVVCVVKHWSEDKYMGIDWKGSDWQGFVIGGVEAGEDPSVSGAREITEETGYKNVEFVKSLGGTVHAKFFQLIKKENRFAHFIPALFKLKNGERLKVDKKEKDLHEVVWLKPAEVEGFLNRGDMKIIWRRVNKESVYVGDGILTDSEEFSGLTSEEAKEKMAGWLEKKKIGGKKINYRLRDWSIARQRYWGTPIPIIYCEKCGIQPVPEKDLPVLLPELPLSKVRPTGTGKGPLAQAKEFVETTCPKCGGKAKRETDTMDTFVDSSFYFLRYPSVGNDNEMMESGITKKWLPVDMYVGGAEHVTMHLLYARFITKALSDAKLINFDEPFSSLRHQGMILGPDGKKMSKSKGNVVIPDKVIKEYGADTFRTYILFMGPFEDGGPWNPKGIVGVKRFLERYWNLAMEVVEGSKKAEAPTSKEGGVGGPTDSVGQIEETALKRTVHKTVKKVGEDIQGFRFNTVVSTLMECLNEMCTIKEKLPPKESSGVWKETIEQFTILLSPLAPHITEEVWGKLVNYESIFTEAWPKYDKKLIKEDIITLVVQVNGKVRGTIEVTPGISQKEAEKEASESQKIQRNIGDKKVIKSFFIPDKLINLIIK